MSENAELPDFHSEGSPRGDFYALAFAKGLYVSPSEKMKDAAFLILNYSPTKGFTRFSFQIVSVSGQLCEYRSGEERHDSIEVALLTAWYEYELPPHLWALFPKSELSLASFRTNRTHEEQHWRARRELGALLYQFRTAAWFKTQECAEQYQFAGPPKPLFRLNTVPIVPNPLKPTAENEEIGEAVASMVLSSRAKRVKKKETK